MYWTFSLTVITSPCLGAVVGGLVTTKFLGSYKNDNALVMCFVVYLLFTAACIPCPFLDNYLIFIIVLWVAIFMQGFIEPIMMGIILSSVSDVERPAASSLSILLEMLFGMLPAPYIYGYVYEATEKLDENGKNISRGGMYTLFFSVVIGLVGLLFALPLRKKSLKASEIRTRKALKQVHPEAVEEEINMIMEGGKGGEGDPQVMNVSNSKDFKM